MFRTRTRIRTMRVCCALVAGLVAPSLAGASASTPPAATIALTGTDGPYGPNLGAGVSFYSLLGAAVDPTGGYSFRGETGDGGNHSAGVWAGSGVSRTALARFGEPVAGLGGTRYSTIGEVGGLWRNGAGETIFEARFSNASPPALNNLPTYLAGTSASSTIIAHQGNTDAFGFNAISGFVANGQRSVAFYGDKTGAELWLGEPGNIRSVAKAGVQAPGAPAGVLFDPAIFTVDLNRNRSLLFFARLRNAGGVSQGTAMYVANDSSVQLLARSTDQAPGLPPGTPIGVMGGYGAIADNGQAAVLANNGLFIGTPGNLRLAARVGDQAPGLAPGVTFMDLQAPVSGGASRIYFSSNLQGPGVGSNSQHSIWVDDGSGAQLAVRDGQSVPGLPVGVMLSAAQPSKANALGQMIIDSELIGSGVNSSNDQFEFVWDPAVGAIPIGRSGDLMLLPTGATKIIASLYDVDIGVLSPGALAPGTNSVLGPNESLGVVTYVAAFTDGSSGSFALVVVPSAPCGAMLAPVILWVGRRRR